MNSKYLVLMSLCAALTSGCASKQPEKLWYSNFHNSAQQFAEDRYACLQESQQPRSGSYAGAARSGQYGSAAGGSYSGMAASGELFSACMEARGYVSR